MKTAALHRLLWQPTTPLYFGLYRIGVGAMGLLLCALLLPDLYLLYGPNGLVVWGVADGLISPYQPSLGKLYACITPYYNVSPDRLLQGVFTLYVAVLVGFTLGIRTRYMAFMAWALHLLLMNTGRFGSYGVESILHVALFYSIFFPCGKALAFDSKWQISAPSVDATLSLRVLQFQLCIIYAASGLEKAVGAEWWNGNAIWYSVTEEQFRQFNFNWLAQVPWVARLAGWWTVIIETGYVLAICWRPTARFWVYNTVAMHVGIFLFMGLHTFALLMITLNLVAFWPYFEGLRASFIPNGQRSAYIPKGLIE